MTNQPAFKPGDRIKHDMLGLGEVLAFDDHGPENFATRIRIRFDESGEKELLYAFAVGKMRLIDENESGLVPRVR